VEAGTSPTSVPPPWIRASGVLVWSSQAGGLLSGKYRRDRLSAAGLTLLGLYL
jgi:hypothetical protein